MKEKLRFVGLDVHAETIAVAVAEPEGEVRSLGIRCCSARCSPCVVVLWKVERTRCLASAHRRGRG